MLSFTMLPGKCSSKPAISCLNCFTQNRLFQNSFCIVVVRSRSGKKIHLQAFHSQERLVSTLLGLTTYYLSKKAYVVSSERFSPFQGSPGILSLDILL